jgi:hypothetical protein
MKISVYFFVFLATITSAFSTEKALDFSKHSNIILTSYFDPRWSSDIIDQLREYIVERNLPDPYNRTFEEPINFDLSKVISTDSDVFKNEIVVLIQKMLKIQFVTTTANLEFQKFGYELGHFSVDVTPEVTESHLTTFHNDHRVKEINVKSKSISLIITVDAATAVAPLVIEVKINNPSLKISEVLLPFNMDWQLGVRPQIISLQLMQLNLLETFKVMKLNSKKVSIDFDSIEIPELSVSVGHKKVSIIKEKVEALIREKKDVFKDLVLDTLVNDYDDQLSDVFGGELDFVFPKELMVNKDVNVAFNIKRFSTIPGAEKVHQMQIDSVVCLAESRNYQACQQNRIQSKAQLPNRDLERVNSYEWIQRTFVEGNAHVALSLSEDFLNSAFTAFFNLGKLRNVLGEDLSFGEMGAAILADKEGEEFTIYLDIVKKLSSSQAVLTGVSELRFPVKFGVSLKIQHKDGVPHVISKVEKVLVTSATLWNGFPEVGFPTSIPRIRRFANKTVRSILEDVKKNLGKELVSVPVNELNVSFLQDMSFLSDGYGMAHILLKFEEKDLHDFMHKYLPINKKSPPVMAPLALQ